MDTSDYDIPYLPNLFDYSKLLAETELDGAHDTNYFIRYENYFKNTRAPSRVGQDELKPCSEGQFRILPQSNKQEVGAVDDMPTKRRSSRGSRRSGNRDDDQGHLLEPGSSREEDEHRHPHAHTNAPATRTESQEKDDIAQRADGQNAAGGAETVTRSASTSVASCKETGIKISQSTDCTTQSNDKTLSKQGKDVLNRTSCSTSALANHNNGADNSFQSLVHSGATGPFKSSRSKPTANKNASSNLLDKPQSDRLTKSTSKHSGADSQVSRQSASGTVDGAASTTSGVSSASQRNKTPVGGGRGRQGGSGGPPLQKVVYYQNRFITIPIDPGDRKQCAAGLRIGPGAAVPSERDSSGSAGRGSGTSRGGGKHGGRPGGGHEVNHPGGGTDNTDNMDPNIAAMAGLGPQPGSIAQAQVIQVAPTPPPKKKKRRTPKILKKIALCLQDNRMRTGSDETKQKIRDMNESQDTTNMILKKILNIIFVTTGITLFLSVVIVIIYTSIGKS